MADDSIETRDNRAAPKPLVAPQQFSLDVLLEKYAKGDERSADDVYRRVARGVAMAEPEALRESVEAASSRTATRRARRGSHHERGRLGHRRNLDQLFRAAGRRQHPGRR